MTQFYPAAVMVVAMVVSVVAGQSAGLSRPIPFVIGLVLASIIAAVWMYSPLPNTNGGMGGVKGAGYWGFKEDDSK